MRFLNFGSLGLALLTSITSGCRRGREVPPPAPVTVAAPEATSADSAAAAAAREREAREAREREAAEREMRARAERNRVNAILTAPIKFAFDRSDLTIDARSALDAKRALLQADPAIRIRIDGHADERGSSEYNLALGMRRAAAARRYLIQREIAPERIEITSLGEERPVCETQEESCWRMNRRDEFAVLAP